MNASFTPSIVPFFLHHFEFRFQMIQATIKVFRRSLEKRIEENSNDVYIFCILLNFIDSKVHTIFNKHLGL